MLNAKPFDSAARQSTRSFSVMAVPSAQCRAAATTASPLNSMHFGFPVVPQGQARVRCQISAAHTRDDLDQALAAFKKVGTKLNLI